jgi:ATP-dependent RNA helicase RhlE
VLVVVPTRELAIQVEQSVRTYGAHRSVRSATVYGGVGFGPQVSRLRAGPEIVVATPGRLLDHIGQRTIDLSQVEVLVLDEADRMLDMGFIRDIRKILALLPARRQNLLFSATFSDEIRGLAAGLLDNPAYVQVAPRNTTVELIDQLVIPVDRERKRDVLRELVALGRVRQALVFTRTKHGANRLAEQLRKDGIEAAAIHGNRSQSQRVKALDDFKAGRADILVATDIAARGLDIEQLPHVVNFELPMVPEDYIHRIGRTGRAGETGQAISLVCVDEAPLLRAIQGLLKRQLPTETIAGYEPDRSIRPEPIRLRSTPAERREFAVQRGARPARPGAGAGVAAGRRRAAPGHHAGAAREETAAIHAQGSGSHGQPGVARGQGTFGPRQGDGGRSGGGGGRGRRPGRGRGADQRAPGTGFGNANPGFVAGGSHAQSQGSGRGPGHGGSNSRDGNARNAGGQRGQAGGQRGQAGGQRGPGGAPRALPGERIRHLG